MAYATLDDLLSRYGEDALEQLTDRSTPPSRALDAGVAQAALDAASSEADSYVGVRYGVPVLPVPPALRDAVLPLAFERLHLHGIPDDVSAAAQRSRGWLRDLSIGRAAIDADGPATSGDAVYVAGLPPLFSAAVMGDF